ncbi:DUF3618 domain-containing protein [Rhodococcus triatomae]|uniref:DUF3618 domain-containing protein n=1 Tax=Rhodococcus triatomae TaxID=300028 RepID=A0A1G8H2K2_9NOCA|nr:DUF3618 domain-containing protein [Rhodococcus triatomae]QNG20227.1 DUF3618 domain-containing protein [Rhodococcus triatomae]QNG23858.1 DUF3618 domain-containing protein [Rhodococcus triatomae]SDI00854.1 Protein of unknown function [Rhodococcus triatomae]
MTSPFEGPDHTSADGSPPVAQQREELAETVDALTKKLDVPARANAAAADTAHAAAVTVRENQPFVVIAAVAVVSAIVAAVVVRRRRR